MKFQLFFLLLSKYLDITFYCFSDGYLNLNERGKLEMSKSEQRSKQIQK